MRLKFFSRADTGTARQTLRLFSEVMASDKKTFRMFSILIPISHFMYIVLLPLLISFIVQSLIEHPHDTTTPLLIIGAMIVSGGISLVIQHKAFIALFNHEEEMTSRLITRAMDGLLRHSQGFFANQKTGSLAGDVNTFSRSYLSLLDTLFLTASPIIVSFVTSLIIIAIIAPLLLVPLVALTVFVIVESLTSLNRRSVYRNKRKELQSHLFGTVADILSNQTLVRMFGNQSREVHTVKTERARIQDVARREIVILQRSAEVRQSGLYIFQAITMLVAVYLAVNDLVSVAALVFTVTYMGRVTGAMYNINSIIRTSEQAFLDAAKITEILGKKIEVTDSPDAKPLQVTSGAIKLSNVGFAYVDAPNESVFDSLNLSITEGQSIGLVGKSGGGKSTLTHLLLRYMDVQDGHIEIDGQPIHNITQQSLRDAIAYVPQDPYLFHRTIRENITYGNHHASEEAVIAAIEQAHAKEFIDTLPNGLDTVVGERGVKLSGGQRQRVAIARAIVKNAPILILDEATSALDSESEKLIQSALENLMKGRTSIVIAHRLSTIAKLDRIIVLDNGKVVEDGTHTELLQAKGMYAKLWSHQSGGFLED